MGHLYTVKTRPFAALVLTLRDLPRPLVLRLQYRPTDSAVLSAGMVLQVSLSDDSKSPSVRLQIDNLKPDAAIQVSLMRDQRPKPRLLVQRVRQRPLISPRGAQYGYAGT